MEEKQAAVETLEHLIGERVSLDRLLQQERGELSPQTHEECERTYDRIQRSLATLFRKSKDETERITIVLELMRILENRLVNLQNFIAEPTAETRRFASLIREFIKGVASSSPPVLSPLERSYYDAIAALYEGSYDDARAQFRASCESEESDEANDIKYKSYVMLGHLSHIDKDYSGARDLHDKSLQYSRDRNVTAQALALKALNSYALQQPDEALDLFKRSLELFDPNEPFFNAYFHRNALSFCGLIHFDRKELDEAKTYYEKLTSEVETDSYDHFDALAQLGKIAFAAHQYDEAAKCLEKAVSSHKAAENEYLVDTYFWLAKTHLKRSASSDARRYLELITHSTVNSERKTQAAELLKKVS